VIKSTFTAFRTVTPRLRGFVLYGIMSLLVVTIFPLAAKADMKEGIIGPESRTLLTRFNPSPALDAKKLRTRLRATQRMVCEDQAATANLVNTNDTIVTVAHLLVRPDGSRRNIANCVFIVDQGNKAIRYAIQPESMKIGNFRGADRRSFGLLEIINDWMVVRLARPVRGITPYALATAPDGSFYPDKAVTTITALSDNWPSKRESTRLAERCRLQNMLGGVNERHAVLIMDCDVGYGSSGGAILVGLSTEQPRLLGLLTDFKEEGLCDRYDPNTCFSAGVATKTVFADAIRAVSETKAVVRSKKKRRTR
jgi:hypothetical protein